MSVISAIKSAASAAAGRRLPRLLTVKQAWHLTPNMIRVVFAGPELDDIPAGRGVAIFEITAAEDKQDIDMPAGITVHWLVHPDPAQPSDAQETLIRSLAWPDGRIQTCIAGESGVIRTLKALCLKEKKVRRDDACISGYWKIGLVEDQHQKLKRTEA